MNSRPKISAAILARAASPQNPPELLAKRATALLKNSPVINWLNQRLKLSRRLDSVALAVGSLGDDHEIVLAAQEAGLTCYGGFPSQILRRLHMVMAAEKADHIVRLNGNFPLVDPWALDELIDCHLAANADYSSNSHYQGLIYGLGAEIISKKALDKILAEEPEEISAAYSGTHLFQQKTQMFKVNLPKAQRRRPDIRVSVEFEHDLGFLENIIDLAGGPEKAVADLNHDTILSIIENQGLTPPGHFNRGGEVGLNKVLLFPEKLSALVRNQEELDTSYPVSVELSLTNICNQQCLWCSDRDLRGRSPDALSLEILERLFQDLKQGGTKGVTIEGGGEPTIWPGFTQAARLALKTGLAVGLITNGLNLFSPVMEPSLYGEFEWVRVSLDAAGRDQYLKTKGGDGFDQVLANIARLASLAPGLTLGVGYVLTNQNDDPGQLQELVLTLRTLKASYIQIRPVVDHPALISHEDLRFLKKFETPQFSINLQALNDNQPSGNLGLPCLAHSLSTVIGADGAVWLCGRLNTDRAARPIGELTRQSFYEIWNSQERNRQTALAANGEFCLANCPQCRMTKYNQLLADINSIKTKNFI